MASHLIAPTWPPPSALTSFIAANSTASDMITSSHEETQLKHLALQVMHQLRHQYDWKELRLHVDTRTLWDALRPMSSSGSEGRGDVDAVASTDSRDQDGEAQIESDPLPRPLLTGEPPRQLYTHPDVQVALIKARKSESDLPVETVVVCPAHLSEGGWTLERLSGVFDVLPTPDRSSMAQVLGQAVRVNGKTVNELDVQKRVLLGVVENDSTTVFYWVHDGLVKPRQN